MGHSDPPTMRRTPMFRQLDAHLSALQELLGGGSVPAEKPLTQ